MATKIIIRGGVCQAVYDDRFRDIFQALGLPIITRATDIEHDTLSGDWIATFRETGEIIARGPNRAQVIENEIKWLEEHLVSHS